MRLRLLLAVAGVLVVAGCTTTANPSSSPASTSGQGRDAVVAVTERSIQPVRTLPATVSSDVHFEVTAPGAGRLVSSAAGLSIVGDDGHVITVTVPQPSADPQVLVPSGTVVPKGLPIVSATFRGFALTAEVSGGTLVDFRSAPTKVRAQIVDAASPFDCAPLDPVPTVSDAATSILSCRIPDDQPVVNGMTGVIAVSFPGAVKVAALPLDAIAGTRDSATVYVKNADGVHLQQVELGVNDGSYVEIKGGLKVGQKVAIPSPTMLSHDG